MEYFKVLKYMLFSLVLGLYAGITPAFSSNLGPSAVSIPLVDFGTSTFYVKTTIGGMKAMNLMLDTGAGYTTINEDSLSQLKKAGEVRFIKNIGGILADGSKRIVPIWRVNRILLSDTCELRDVEVAIFPGKSRQLLGVSALKKVGPMTLSFNPPLLTLQNC